VAEFDPDSIGQFETKCFRRNKLICDRRTYRATDQNSKANAGDALQNNDSDYSAGCSARGICNKGNGKLDVFLTPLRDSHGGRPDYDETKGCNACEYSQDWDRENYAHRPRDCRGTDKDCESNKNRKPDRLTFNIFALRLPSRGHPASGESLGGNSQGRNNHQKAEKRPKRPEISRI